MGQDKKGGYCRHCEQQRLLIRDTPNHILHLLLTVFTVGAWFFIWILLCLLSGTAKWRCSQCGSVDVDPPALFSEQAPGPSKPTNCTYKKKVGLEFWAAIFIIIMGSIAAEHAESDIIPGLIIIGGIIWLIMDRFDKE